MLKIKLLSKIRQFVLNRKINNSGQLKMQLHRSESETALAEIEMRDR
jgi:hypothetical protein